MSLLRSFGLSTLVVLVAACGGPGQTAAPATGTLRPAASPTPVVINQPSAPTVTAVPTAVDTPSAQPGASLDPSQSDAGIVARLTLSNDTFGERDGTYDVIGLAADGSDCSLTFEGDEFIAVAWHTDVPNGQIHRFGISLDPGDVPTSDGSITDIEDGRLSFDFVSESGFGTQYTGDATSEDEGHVTLDVTRDGTSLTFDFDGATSAHAQFVGQMICAEG